MEEPQDAYFALDTLEQMRGLSWFAKEYGALRFVTLWELAALEGYEQAWASCIIAVFTGENRCAIVAQKTDGNPNPLFELKYRSALAWCRENLREIQETELYISEEETPHEAL